MLTKNINTALVVSDIHLGSPLCKAEEFIFFLQNYTKGYEALIINGDLFESMDARLKKRHWQCLSELRKLSDHLEIIWIKGNHDEPEPETFAHILGIEVVDSLIINSKGKRILCIHGDKWDDFIVKYPLITSIADFFYNLLSKVNHNFCHILKRSSKTFLRNVGKVNIGAKTLARKHNCCTAICGHTHFPQSSSGYINSGCWTEYPPTYVTITNGEVCLKSMLKNQKTNT